ncbi:MAG: MSMEG_1061 family FMN-dependent PPOX-type flavoprotein [Ilumatobacteraceae bacterium]
MFDPHRDDHRIGSLEQLRTFYRHAHEGTRNKERPALGEATAAVAARCRFLAIGTFDAEGNADVSPRGGPSGFLRVLDPGHLAMADLGGNNRLDTLENIVATGRVALLLITPGQTETVRVNGTAWVSTDPDLLAGFDLPKPPKSAIVVRVETTYMHCAKAFMRSGMWDTEVWAELADVPDGAAVLSCQGVVDVDAATTRQWLDDDYAAALAEERTAPGA